MFFKTATAILLLLFTSWANADFSTTSAAFTDFVAKQNIGVSACFETKDVLSMTKSSMTTYCKKNSNSVDICNFWQNAYHVDNLIYLLYNEHTDTFYVGKANNGFNARYAKRLRINTAQDSEPYSKIGGQVTAVCFYKMKTALTLDEYYARVLKSIIKVPIANDVMLSKNQATEMVDHYSQAAQKLGSLASQQLLLQNELKAVYNDVSQLQEEKKSLTSQLEESRTHLQEFVSDFLEQYPKAADFFVKLCVKGQISLCDEYAVVSEGVIEFLPTGTTYIFG